MGELSDEDKRLAEEMRRRQRERREYIAQHGHPPEGEAAAPAPGDADKHAAPIGLDDAGTPFPVTASIVEAYRDKAHRFSLMVPGSPQRAPAGDADAAFRLIAGAFSLQVRVRARAAGDDPLELARAAIGDAAVARTVRQTGVTAAASGSRLDGHQLTDVDVLAGDAAIATLILRHDASAIDPATAATVRAAIAATAAFGDPEYDVLALWPESPWLASELPLRLRNDRPPVPAIADRAQVAGALLGVLGPAAPAYTLRSDVRAAVEAVLEAAFGDAFESLSEQLTTAHDVRGLALAILRG